MELPRYTYGTHAGRLMASTDLGGYPLYYLDGQGMCLCVNCARKSDEDADELPAFKPVSCGVNWENEDGHLYCDNCNAIIPAAYGNDEEEE